MEGRNVTSSVALVSEGGSEFTAILAYCQVCGKPIKITNSTQRFCSESCKSLFSDKVGALRRKKRNEYQKQFRSSKYKSEVKHIQKIECPKCGRTGYLVRYSVRNKMSDHIVSAYETVRHQVTQGGKSILLGQCYLRSLKPESVSEKKESEVTRVIQA